MPTIDVYSRRGCHLCEDLLEDLCDLVRDRASVVVHDIDSRDDWREKYDRRVPVVEIAGAVLCEFRLDRQAILIALAVEA